MRFFVLLLTACFITACSQAAPRPADTKLKEPTDMTAPADAKSIVLAAGCFWCVEAVYQQLEGVYSVESGYSGGHTENPTYEATNTKTTGHVEAVQVKYDPNKISLEKILEWFWALHDPTQDNGQGNDIGPQYLSVIFYGNPAEKAIVEKSKEAAQQHFKKPIATTIREAATFWSGEDYHQDYYFLNKDTNSYCSYVITPKLKKLNLNY